MHDPYARCMCGSGKAIKWCCAKAVSQIQKIEDYLDREDPERALEAFNKAKLEVATPGYDQCLLARIYLALEKVEDAMALLEKAAREHPRYGLPRQLLAGLRTVTSGNEAAIDDLRAAISLFPPEAVEHRVACLIELGNLYHLQRKPLATWAAWQRAHKLMPEHEDINQGLERLRGDSQIPHFLKGGGALKQPDEFSVFNEDRRKRWDECFAKEADWQLDDMAEAFEFLSNDDPSDAAALYNLGIVNAWLGRNVAAIEALMRYVDVETDPEAAANAADVAMLLRIGEDCGNLADGFNYAQIFQVVDPEGFSTQMRASKRMLLTAAGEEKVVYWTNRDMDEPTAANLLTKPLRMLSQLQFYANFAIATAYSEEDIEEFQSAFVAEFGKMVEVATRNRRPVSPQHLDFEPMTYMPPKGQKADESLKFLTTKHQQYFEEKWIHMKLPSLRGLAPIDATQRPADRARLEGGIRFRERVRNAKFKYYDFDRLRNKLGIEVKRLADDDIKVRDISTLPVAELVKLTPSELTDDELLIAYRSANSLDAPRTALQFGEEMIGRESLAGKMDIAAVFKRIVADRIEHNYKTGLLELLGKAVAFDKKHYGGEHLAEFRMLEGRARLLEGDADGACKLFQEIADKESSNLGLLASVVEKLLSAGVYKKAHEFAKLGLSRAESARQRDFQEQFKDYVAASARRL